MPRTASSSGDGGHRVRRKAAYHLRVSLRVQRGSSMSRRGPLLRLVHSLERRKAARSYVVRLELSRLSTLASGPGLASAELEVSGPHAFLVGSGEQVDLSAPPGLLERHLVVLTVPSHEGVEIRVLSLHPERGMVYLKRSAGERVEGDVRSSMIDAADDGGPREAGTLSSTVGGIVGWGRVSCVCDDHLLDVQATLEREGTMAAQRTVRVFAKGEQLTFHNATSVRPVGDVVSSISGPGGHSSAIPALVSAGALEDISQGNLVLRSRDGMHVMTPSTRELTRGLLIGRSRRCVLGRGFDENDGLSRLHALAISLGDRVYAFDLASRYGLRDVARPTRLLRVAQLDDGVGCLVYGAGHLVFER